MFVTCCGPRVTSLWVAAECCMLFLHACGCAAFVAVGLMVLRPLVLLHCRKKINGGLCGVVAVAAQLRPVVCIEWTQRACLRPYALYILPTSDVGSTDPTDPRPRPRRWERAFSAPLRLAPQSGALRCGLLVLKRG